jgi:hypothetical protein
VNTKSDSFSSILHAVFIVVHIYVLLLFYSQLAMNLLFLHLFLCLVKLLLVMTYEIFISAAAAGFP